MNKIYDFLTIRLAVTPLVQA